MGRPRWNRCTWEGESAVATAGDRQADPVPPRGRWVTHAASSSLPTIDAKPRESEGDSNASRS